MTDRYEIARMALKSGFAYEAATGHIVATSGYTEVICTAGLERFAALVAAAERDRACYIVTGLCISDNNAREINKAIQGKPWVKTYAGGKPNYTEPDDGNPSF